MNIGRLRRSVEPIKIDPEGRYILLLQFADYVSPEDQEITIPRVREMLRQWWDSGEKFGVFFAASNEVLVTIQRVDKPLDNSA